jgi:hypothetical protein
VKIEVDAWHNLYCPRCNENNLHLRRTVHYCRTEDDPLITVVSVDNISGFTTVDKMNNDESNNPSSRRDGMQLLFYCESDCTEHKPLILNISQHKGTTNFEWDE